MNIIDNLSFNLRLSEVLKVKLADIDLKRNIIKA
jgi:hypothetical protein